MDWTVLTTGSKTGATAVCLRVVKLSRSGWTSLIYMRLLGKLTIWLTVTLRVKVEGKVGVQKGFENLEEKPGTL